MASIREKLQRVHAPRPTEAPASPAAREVVPEPAARPVAQERREPVARREPLQREPAPAPAPKRPAPTAPAPMPEDRGDRINELRSRLDRVFNPSMKAAAKKAEEQGDGFAPRGLQPREVVVVPTDEPVMRPRKRATAKSAEGPAERAPKRAAAKVAKRETEPTRAPAWTVAEEQPERLPRRPLVMEPAAFEEAPRMPARAAMPALPMPVASEGVPTADTRHRWSALRSEVLQARALNDEARALSLLREMAALPSTDAWPHVELARYYETVAHDYERALAHIRVALSRASWNGGYKSQLARLEAKLRRG